MSDNSKKQDIDNMTFEEALKSLEEIVGQLDSGEIDLDKAVEAYERGTNLKTHFIQHLPSCCFPRASHRALIRLRVIATRHPM